MMLDLCKVMLITEAKEIFEKLESNFPHIEMDRKIQLANAIYYLKCIGASVSVGCVNGDE